MADPIETVAIAAPTLRAAHEAKDRLRVVRRETQQNEPRQQIMAAGEPHHADVEIAESNAPLHGHWAQALRAPGTIVEQSHGILRLDAEAIVRRRLENWGTKLAQPGHCVLGRCRDLGMPVVFEILDAEQVGAGLAQQALDREQSAHIDIARVQFDFGHQPIEHLKLDEAEIADGKSHGIVVGGRVAQGSEELLAVRQHQFALGSDQHCQKVQTRLRDAGQQSRREDHSTRAYSCSPGGKQSLKRSRSRRIAGMHGGDRNRRRTAKAFGAARSPEDDRAGFAVSASQPCAIADAGRMDGLRLRPFGEPIPGFAPHPRSIHRDYCIA